MFPASKKGEGRARLTVGSWVIEKKLSSSAQSTLVVLFLVLFLPSRTACLTFDFACSTEEGYTTVEMDCDQDECTKTLGKGRASMAESFEEEEEEEEVS